MITYCNTIFSCVIYASLYLLEKWIPFCMLLLSLQFYRLTDHTMKKLSALVLALGFLFFLGCAKTTPTTINDAS